MDNDLLQTIRTLSTTPVIGDIIRGAANNLFGAPPAGMDNWFGIDTSKTLAWNIAASERYQFTRNNLRAAEDEAVKNATINFFTNMHRLAGSNMEQSEKAAKAAADSPIGSLAGILYAPQMLAASSHFGTAAYRRISDRLNSPGYTSAVKSLWTQTLTDAAAGKMAGLDIADSGHLAAELVGTGGLSVGTLTGDELKTRVKEVASELKDYAQSVGTLKDIIKGPVDQILQSFEALTGTKLTSMSTGNAAVLTSSLRNVVFNTGASTAQIANYTARQYGLIAPYGGTLAQASALATATAAAVHSGYRIEGLSEIELSEGLAKDAARRINSGELRKQAAAYQHWRLSANLEDNLFTRSRFNASIRNVDEYIRNNNIDPAFYSSRLVTNTMADPNFTTQARLEQFQDYQQRLDSMDLSSYGKNVSQETIRSIIKNNYYPSKMLLALRKSGMDTNSAARLVREVSGVAMGAFRTNNDLLAFGYAATAQNADAIQKSNLGGMALQHLRGQSLKDGFEGVFNYLNKSPNEIDPGVASLITSWIGGVTTDTKYYTDRLNNKEKRKETLDELKGKLEAAIGKENVDAVFTKDPNGGVDWGANAGYLTLLSAKSKVGDDGVVLLDQKGRNAAVKEALRAVRVEKNLSMSRLNELTANLEISDENKAALLLANKLGVTPDENAVKQYLEFEKESNAFLKGKKKLTGEALTNAASDMAIARVQGRAMAETLRWGDTGLLTTEQTVAKIFREKEGTAKGLWKHAATLYNNTVRAKDGQTFDRLDRVDQEKFLREQFVSRGGMQEILTEIMLRIPELIAVLERFIKTPPPGKK